MSCDKGEATRSVENEFRAPSRFMVVDQARVLKILDNEYAETSVWGSCT